MVLWTAITQHSFGSPQLRGQVHDLCFTILLELHLSKWDLLIFFLWTRPSIEFRGSFFWNEKNFSEQFDYKLLGLQSFMDFRASQRGKPPPDMSPALARGSWGQQGLCAAAELGAGAGWARQGWPQPLLALIQLFSRPRRCKEPDLQLLWTSISFMRPHIPLSNGLTQGKSPLCTLKSVCSSSKVGRNCVPLLSWQVTPKTEQA